MRHNYSSILADKPTMDVRILRALRDAFNPLCVYSLTIARTGSRLVPQRHYFSAVAPLQAGNSSRSSCR